MSKEENVRKAINKARFEFFLDSERKPSDCENIADEHLLKYEFIERNMENVEKGMGIKPSWFPLKDVCYETFQTAAKMFFSLNYCPPKESFLFIDILKNLPPKDIILALSNILKSTNKNVKKFATPVWLHFSKKYNLKQTLVEKLYDKKQPTRKEETIQLNGFIENKSKSSLELL